MDIYFVLWVIIDTTYFVSQIVPALTIGHSFAWLSCTFDIPHHFLGHLYFVALHDAQVHLIYIYIYIYFPIL